jgi:hypothetical protein
VRYFYCYRIRLRTRANGRRAGEAAITAVGLFQQQRFAEAIPHFEIVIKAMPDQAEVRFMYVLLAEPDEEIAQEHSEYLKNNRPKLRQYVVNYVIQR